MMGKNWKLISDCVEALRLDLDKLEQQLQDLKDPGVPGKITENEGAS